MKLYIDGLFYKGSGIGRYYESLTKEFAKRGIKVYTAVYKRLQKDFEKDFQYIDNIEPIFVDYKKYSAKGFLFQSKILKALEKKIDLFFYPHINLPLYIPKNTIVTIHDLRLFTNWWDRNSFKKQVFKLFLDRSVIKSKYIICISHTVKEELAAYNPKISNKIQVIYEFIDDKFIKSVKTTPVISEPYILFIGNRKKHKNLGLLLKAFALIKDSIPHKLVIAGARDSEVDEVDILKKKLNLSNAIKEFINPPDEIVISLYQNADLFVFPSLFEGFGLPPLEAVSLGTPVILSDIPIFKEVLSDAGFYFDPFSEQDLAEKIYNVLSNKEVKDDLLKRQKDRLPFFDKNKVIDEYIDLFKKL